MERLGFLIAAMAVTAAAAWYDWRKGEIPDWVTLGPLAAGLVAHAVLGGMTHGARGAFWSVIGSLLGAIACGLVPVFLWWKGAIGGGDVKLLVAIGALLGHSLGIEAELYGFIAAALYAPARLAYEGKLLRTLGNTFSLAFNPVLPKAKRREVSPEMMTWLRFGPPMFVGMCVTVLLNWRGP
ncbi:MAG: prepilin peptidase [Deltaproteobacteria bacterium]|nr:prepilin peptidase [Deltaproteobacteria bacterium]